MKKIAAFILGVIVLSAVWYGESRKFFCLSNGRCITVWKTYNNTCYIIPGKYYSPSKPSLNYIESTNTNGLTFFFTDALPNTWIYSSEQNIKANNDNRSKWVFYDYSSNKKKFDGILYKPKAQKFSDIKENVELIEVYVLGNYATDKKGKKI